MSMAHTQIHLLVPGLLGPMKHVADLESPPSAALIERLITRADKSPFADQRYQSTLFRLFGITAAGKDYPTGAVNGLADGLQRDQRFWFQINPVSLRPDQDRLLLFDSFDLDFTLAESKALAALFNQHFSAEGWHLEVVTPHRWYLAVDEIPRITTSSIDEVFGRSIDRFLPEGIDALRWHSILNETQMLFHGAEVNQLRESAGKLPINGIWISGGGVLPDAVQTPFDTVLTDSTLAWGLAKLAGVSQACLPATLDRLSGNQLITYDALHRPVWRADPYDWSEALQKLDAFIQPLVDLLYASPQAELFLYPCDGSVYRINRNKLRRFWRRTKPMAMLMLGE